MKLDLELDHCLPLDEDVNVNVFADQQMRLGKTQYLSCILTGFGFGRIFETELRMLGEPPPMPCSDTEKKKQATEAEAAIEAARKKTEGKRKSSNLAHQATEQLSEQIEHEKVMRHEDKKRFEKAL